MARRRCRNCRKKFYPKHINKAKLCSRCAPMLGRKARRVTEQLANEVVAMPKIKKLESKLLRCEKILAHARKLAEYEKIGGRITDPSSSEIIRRFNKMKKSLVNQGIETAIHDGMTAVRAALSRRGKETAFSRMRTKIIKAGEIAQYYCVALDSKRKTLLVQAKLREVIYQGNKAKFDGDALKALTFYRKGLARLLADDIDDGLQVRELSLLKASIAKIEGMP